MKRILAKSIKSDNLNDLEALTLPGHLKLGIIAAQAFEEIAPTICQQCNLKMSPQELIQTVVLAIWLHDWGKANEDFQAMVQKKSSPELLKKWFGISKKLESPRTRQLIRHELLSVILAKRQSVHKWLSNTEADFNIALLAVLGHHLKVKDSSYFEIASDSLKVYTHTEDFQKILQLGCDYLKLDKNLPELPRKSKKDEFEIGELKEKSKKLGGDATNSWSVKIENYCAGDLDKLKKIAVVKALTMAADLGASALLEKERGNRSYEDWIKDALSQVMTESDYQEIIKQKLGNNELLDFQKKAEELATKSRVLIVTAGCGAGKSLVPMVVFGRLTREEQLQAKLFFCYPTTATTSQGFMDYAVPTEIENKLLMHSRSWVDEQLKLKDFLDIYDDEDDDNNNQKNDNVTKSQINDNVAQFQTKVDALKLWHSKLIYCTAHTVLGLLQNHRKGIYGFPGIAQGVFVFDEIAAYPPKLFGAMLQFLRVFSNAKVVLMSASLTQQQEQAIQEVLAETGESAEVISGPKEIEQLKRYQIISIPSQDDAWSRAIAELKQNGKVLWITNQVADSQLIYTEAKEKFESLGIEVNTLVYHSRFRYQDANICHKDLINAFRGDKPAFAVTTQIAEMSLDISATLLISANAPIWALIQRLGRLNRWVEKTEEGYRLKTGRICQALIYPWQKEKPYEIKDLQTGKTLVETLKNQDINQLQLTEELGKVSTKVPTIDKSNWLKTWQATPGELMPPGYTIQVILEDDQAKVLNSPEKPFLEAQKFAVSVRIQKGKTHQWQRKTFKFYRIAPTEDVHYHPEIGAYNPNEQNFLKAKYGHETEARKSIINAK